MPACMQADKRWQLADWRVRPLSEEALLYARMDTHYLLYMYDRIKVCAQLRELSSRWPLSIAQNYQPGSWHHETGYARLFWPSSIIWRWCAAG